MDVDPTLVRACQRGERGALDSLIRASYADVYRLARRMLADPDEAADATQEVFVRVMRSVVGFRGDAAFGTWLHRVTVNVCLTMLKKRSQAREAGLVAGYTPFAMPDDVLELAGNDASPDDRAETADLVANLFVECVVAPKFDETAVEVLGRTKNLRVLEGRAAWAPNSLDYKRLRGGVLVQERAPGVIDDTGWTVPTKRSPTSAELADLRPANRLIATRGFP